MDTILIITITIVVIIVAILTWAAVSPCTFCKDYDTDDAPWYSFLCFKGEDFDSVKAKCDWAPAPAPAKAAVEEEEEEGDVLIGKRKDTGGKTLTDAAIDYAEDQGIEIEEETVQDMKKLSRDAADKIYDRNKVVEFRGQCMMARCVNGDESCPDGYFKSKCNTKDGHEALPINNFCFNDNRNTEFACYPLTYINLARMTANMKNIGFSTARKGAPKMLHGIIDKSQNAFNKLYIEEWIKPAESSGKISFKDKNGQTREYNINDLAHNNQAIMEEPDVKASLKYWRENP